MIGEGKLKKTENKTGRKLLILLLSVLMITSSAVPLPFMAGDGTSYGGSAAYAEDNSSTQQTDTDNNGTSGDESVNGGDTAEGTDASSDSSDIESGDGADDQEGSETPEVREIEATVVDADVTEKDENGKDVPSAALSAFNTFWETLTGRAAEPWEGGKKHEEAPVSVIVSGELPEDVTADVSLIEFDESSELAERALYTAQLVLRDAEGNVYIPEKPVTIRISGDRIAEAIGGKDEVLIYSHVFNDERTGAIGESAGDAATAADVMVYRENITDEAYRLYEIYDENKEYKDGELAYRYAEDANGLTTDAAEGSASITYDYNWLDESVNGAAPNITGTVDLDIAVQDSDLIGTEEETAEEETVQEPASGEEDNAKKGGLLDRLRMRLRSASDSHNAKVTMEAGEFNSEDKTVTYTVTVEAEGDMDYGDKQYDVIVSDLTSGENALLDFTSGSYTYAHGEGAPAQGAPESTVNRTAVTSGATSFTSFPLTIGHMYDGDKITLTYTAAVKGGDYDGTRVKVNNTASISVKDSSEAVSPDDVGSDNSASKETSFMYNALKREMTGLEGSWASWKVDVNPDGYILDGSKTLTLIDTFDDEALMSTSQSIDYSSVLVSGGEGITYDYSGYTGTFRNIPDGTHVTVTYRTRIKAKPGDNAAFGGSAVLENSSGETIGEAAVHLESPIYPSASDVSGSDTNYMVKLYTYADGSMQTGVAGARFILMDANKRPLEYRSGGNKGEPVTFTTGENGIASVELHEEENDVSIEKNTDYYLEMIQAPKGYQKDNTLYHFLITDDPSYGSGSSYNYYNGDTMKVRLYKATNDLRVTLRFSGNYSLTPQQQNGVAAVLQKAEYDEETQTYQGWEEVERHYNSDAQWGAITFSTELQTGTKYRVVQENQRPWDVPESIILNSTYYCIVGSGTSDPHEQPQEFILTETAGVNVVIDNRYEKPQLSITKMNKETGEKLQGAEFKVFEAKTGAEVTSLTTDSEGMIVISGGGPYESETLYYTEETQAPDGYLLPLREKKLYFYFCNDPAQIPDILADLPEGETAVNLTETYDSVSLDNQPESRTIPVMKIWQGSKWPDDVTSVVVGLYKETENRGAVAVEKDGQPMTVSLTKGAPYDNKTFKDLPTREDGKNVVYSIKEEHVYKDSTDVIGDYVQEYGVSDSGIYIVRNSEGTTLTVNKKWYDSEGHEATGSTLAAQSDVTFDVYRSTSKIPEETRTDGITYDEMKSFVSSCTKVRDDLTFGKANNWTATVTDIAKKDDANNPYYYYVLEEVPSFGDETYEVDETNGTVTINNKVAPGTASLTVKKAKLEGDPREESADREFDFTLTLRKGERPIRGYTVADGLTTDINGKAEFKLKPEHQQTFSLPKGAGVTAVITEAYNPEYIVSTSTEDISGGTKSDNDRTFSYEVTGNGTITYTNTLHVICNVVDKNGNNHPYESLNSALKYIREHSSDAYIEGVATIQMLEDYTMTPADAAAFKVREGENIILTTATTDTSAPFHFKTDRTEETDIAYITRGEAIGTGLSMLSNEGTLTLQKVCLNGAGISTETDGGIVSSSGILNIYDDAKLRNAVTSGKGGAVYASAGTVNMTGGEISGSSAENGSAIWLYAGTTLNLSGGKINGNSGASDGAVVISDRTSKVNISGSPQITDNRNKDNADANIYINVRSIDTLYVSSPGLEATALIGVTAQGGHDDIGETFATTASGNDRNLGTFVNDKYGYRGKLKEGSQTQVVWDGLTLQLKKEFDGQGSNPNDRFTITLSSRLINRSSYVIGGTVYYTVTPAKDNNPGTIEFTNIKAGDVITIAPLPVGSYTISEEESVYDPTFTGQNTETQPPTDVVISDGDTFYLDGNSTITARNKRRTANVDLTKKLTDKLVGDGSVAFNFKVKLTDPDGTALGGFRLAEGITTGDDGETGEFTLSPTNAGAVTQLLKAPVGAVMTITETENPDYRIKTSAKTHPAEGGGADIEDLDSSKNVFEFKVTDDGADVNFGNERRINTISLGKKLVGKVSKQEDFNFNLTLIDRHDNPLSNYVMYSSGGTEYKTDSDGHAVIPFSFGDNESSKSVPLDIPEGTKLTIVEDVPNDFYNIDYSLNGDPTISGNSVRRTIVEDDRSIVFTNTRKTRQITVKNTVNGYSGNVTPFTFTATVQDGTKAKDYDDNGFTDGVQTFELATGQSKVLTVPYGATLKVKEDFIVGYDTTVKRGSEAAITATEIEYQVNASETLAFVNTQLIGLRIVNNTSSKLEGVQIYVGYGTRMYRVNETGDGQERVTQTSGRWATIDIESGKTAILEINHKSGITDTQDYTVTGNAPASGYLYTINNEPSYHEYANPAIQRVYNADPYEVKGQLRYSTIDSIVTISEQPLVSFDVNGGAWTTEMEDYHDRDGDRQVYQKAVDKNSTVSRPAPDPVYPTAEGIDFLGWTDDKAVAEADHSSDTSIVEYDFTRPVTGPVTLYAVWKKAVRADRVVTLKNSTGTELNVSIGSTTIRLPNGGSENHSVDNGTDLVLTLDETAFAVSSQYTITASNGNKTFTVNSVNRDGTITFTAGICKITDAEDKILYKYDGTPAVYPTLAEAFSDYNGTLYKDHSHTVAEQAKVKMLIDEYAISSNHAFPTRDVILTTAGKDDEDFPYAGTTDCAVLYRAQSFTGDSMFSLASSGREVTLTKIILDGKNVGVVKGKNGNLVYVDNANAVLNINDRTTLRNTRYAAYDDGNNSRGAVFIKSGTLNVNAGLFSNLHARSGGAICAEGSAIMHLAGTSGSTRFENCDAVASGGAVYYGSSADITIDGGSDNGFMVDEQGNTQFDADNKKIEVSDPGIVFDSCVAKNSNNNNEGNGGAIYITSDGVAVIRGCSFVECSAKVNINDNRQNGGGAIAANKVNTLTVSNCTFNACDTLTTGGAIFARIKDATTMTVNNCIFRYDSCKGQGGGIGVYQWTEKNRSTSLLTINGCRFENCSSGTQNGSGGSIQSYLPCMSLINSDFTDCWAGKEGGAINHFYEASFDTIWPESYLTVTSCEFTRCRAEDRYQPTYAQHYGGGINTKAYKTTVEDSQFTDCVSTLREGGALHLGGRDLSGVTGSNATIKRSTFKNCVAKTAGGAVLASTYTLTVEDSFFYGCKTSGKSEAGDTGRKPAQEGGGAISHSENRRNTSTQGTTTITNCTFSADPNGGDDAQSCSTATDGGAIWTKAGTTEINDCDIINTSAGTNGGAIYAQTQNLTISGCHINGCEAGTSGGGVYQARYGNSATYGTYQSEIITGCKAPNGSAVFVADNVSATFSGIKITGNTVSSKDHAAVEGGGNGSKLYFEGNVQVKDNTCSADSSCDHNVLMQRNDNNDANMTIVQTTSVGLSDTAYVGVYVPDSVYERRGTEGKVFGTHGDGNGQDNLECFINDRNGLIGYKASSSKRYIYWGDYLCKITDAEGNTLKRANGRDAVYQRLTLALDDFTNVKDEAGETGQAVYIKILVENYPLLQNEAITNFPAANVTITTAGTDDPDHKYRGEPGTLCTIYRDSKVSTGNNQLFKIGNAATTLQFESITLDGRKDLEGTVGSYRMISAEKGKVVVNGGTTLQYGFTGGNGGAIEIYNAAASLEINSSEGKDVLFDHCIQQNDKDAGGGAIYSKSSVTINSSGNGKTVFSDCNAKRGGAIMIESGNASANLTVEGTEFKNCYSMAEGGAIYQNNNNNTTSRTDIRSSSFENCYTIANEQWSYGGAVNAKTAYLNVEGCRFTNCYARSSGGAINHGSQNDNRVNTTITDTIFESCSTTGNHNSYGYGGSVYTQAKSVEISGGSFSNSTSYNHGGALHCANNNCEATLNGVSIENCIVKRNGGYSGAVYMAGDNSGLNVSGNTTIKGCYAKQGGAIYLKNKVTMNISGSPKFEENGFATVNGTVVSAEEGACIYLAKDSRLNLSGSPGFRRNILPAQGQIINGSTEDYVRQDIFLAGYSGTTANSIYVTGELSGDMIWVWPEQSPHRVNGEQFAKMEGEISDASLSMFRNALPDTDTNCSNGEFLAGVRIEGDDTNVYWDKMYQIQFNKTDNKDLRVSGAVFTMYRDAACTREYKQSTSADGVVDFTSVRIGAYYMKETREPTSFRPNNVKYLILAGSPYLSKNENNKYLWEGDGPLAVDNAETLVAQQTTNQGRYVGVFALGSEGKVDFSKGNIILDPSGIVNMRMDFEAYFMKTDSSGEALPGAGFTVYEQTVDEEGHPETYSDGYPKLKKWVHQGESEDTPATKAESADGRTDKWADGTLLPKGLVYFPELPIGTYYLLEEKYPGRNGSNRITFYVETDRVLQLEVKGENGFTLKELQSGSDYVECSKIDVPGAHKYGENYYYKVDNTEAVCKMTDGKGHLLYKLGRGGQKLPALYPSLADGFEAANGSLYDKDGAAIDTNSALKLQALKDADLNAPVNYSSGHSLTFTTAATTATQEDRYIFSTRRTDDPSRAEISRAYSEDTSADANNGALININGSAMTLQNISLNGHKSQYNGRAIHVTGGGSLSIQDHTRIHDFKQEASAGSAGSSDIRGGAVLMDDGTSLSINGGNGRLALFSNNEVINKRTSGATGADGGAIATGSNCTIAMQDAQFTGNKATAAAGSGNGGALSIDPSNYSSDAPLLLKELVLRGNTASDKGGAIDIADGGNVKLQDGLIENNRAAYGSALNAGNNTNVTFIDGSVTGNVATAANGGAVNVGNDAKLYFGGSPTIFNNRGTDNSQRNVVLSADSNGVINTSPGTPLRGGKIGVYVIDGEGVAIYNAHGLPGMPFGTFYNSNDKLSVFVNDRQLDLYGVRSEDDSEDVKIYWLNTGEQSVILRKVNSGYTALEGAKFVIYKSDKKTRVTGVDINGRTTSTFTSGSSGVYFIGSLPYGTYFICETETPDGYETLSDGKNWYRLIVDENGTTVSKRLTSEP